MTQFQAQQAKEGKPPHSEHFETPSNNDNVCLLYSVYNQCAFTKECISVDSSWETLLGSHQYEDVRLQTCGMRLQPYGPFNIQLQNQGFRWNTAIVVEPVLSVTPNLAQSLHVFKGSAIPRVSVEPSVANQQTSGRLSTDSEMEMSTDTSEPVLSETLNLAQSLHVFTGSDVPRVSVVAPVANQQTSGSLSAYNEMEMDTVGAILQLCEPFYLEQQNPDFEWYKDNAGEPVTIQTHLPPVSDTSLPRS